MAKINLLDKSVYNQISAGEVVENPASIVKELVENSIDAGADILTVSIEDGGIKSITVTDNGCGMEKEDLYLAILPHATSKIKVASDIDTVDTLGFRGEALASISAISELTIKSKYVENDIANFIEVKGGEVVAEGICAISCGTQISVRSLFYNTPARYKFLKTPKGEENNITSLMAELIFANPTVSITYIVDGTTVYKSTGNDLFDSIFSVFGDKIAQNMIHFEFNENGYRISGYTARPASEAIKNNRTKQTFIVNGRVISDQTISAVIQNAYGELLMKRTFPVVILDIIMPFDMVDVNVHPNKKEVRFADSKKINGIIYHAIKNAVEKDAEEMQKSIFAEFHKVDDIKIGSATTKVEPINNTLDAEDGYLPDNRQNTFQNLFSKPFAKKVEPMPTMLTFSDSKPINSYSKPTDSYIKPSQPDVEVIATELPKPSYKIVGQVFDTYIIIEIEDKIIFIDQHATHERILFDKLVENTKNNIEVQGLLMPYIFDIEDDDREFFKVNKENFSNLGFSIEVYDKSICVTAIPAILVKMNIEAFLREVSSYKTELKQLTDSAIIKDKIAKFACKSAIKGGESLGTSQIEYVMDYFFKNSVPLQCPHGRPTMIKFTRTELERFFGRKV